MGEVSVFGLIPDHSLVYSLMEIKFHTKSEHKINDTQYSIEMQMVHILNRDYAGHTQYSKLIISVFFEQLRDDLSDIYGESEFLEQFHLDTLSVRRHYI